MKDDRLTEEEMKKLEPPKTRRVDLSRRRFAPCPRCGAVGGRHGACTRRVLELGVSGPTALEVIYTKHYCRNCRRHFTAPLEHIAPAGGRFTYRVRRRAVELVVKEAMTLERASLYMSANYHVRVPVTTIHGWAVEALFP